MRKEEMERKKKNRLAQFGELRLLTCYQWWLPCPAGEAPPWRTTSPPWPGWATSSSSRESWSTRWGSCWRTSRVRRRRWHLTRRRRRRENPPPHLPFKPSAGSWRWRSWWGSVWWLMKNSRALRSILSEATSQIVSSEWNWIPILPLLMIETMTDGKLHSGQK